MHNLYNVIVLLLKIYLLSNDRSQASWRWSVVKNKTKEAASYFSEMLFRSNFLYILLSFLS